MGLWEIYFNYAKDLDPHLAFIRGFSVKEWAESI